MQYFWTAFRYWFRSLRRNPATNATTLATLILATGFAAAVFSIVNAKCLQSLLYGKSQNLAILWKLQPRGGRTNFSLHDYRTLAGTARTFEELAAVGATELVFRSDPAVRLGAGRVSANFFRTLQVQPFLGRTFDVNDEQLGNTHLVVLSHGVWTKYFGADPTVINRSITLDGEPWAVIGVMPREFTFMRANAIWIPLAGNPQRPDAEYQNSLLLFGRLSPSATTVQATQEVDSIIGRIEPRNSQSHSRWGAFTRSLQEELTGRQRSMIWMLFGAACLLFVVAVANITYLVLIQLLQHRNEIALRICLGASRLKMFLHIIMEFIPMGLVASAVGLLLAWKLTAYFDGLPMLQAPGVAHVRVDWAVGLFIVATFLIVPLTMGFLLLGLVRNVKLQAVLRSATTIAGTSHNRALPMLVAAQVSLAIVLLTGSSLLLRSFLNLVHVPVGFDSRNLVTMRISLSASRHNEIAIRNFYGEALSRIRALPNVQEADIASTLPLFGWNEGVQFRTETSGVESASDNTASQVIVSSTYFKTLGIRILQGTDFAESQTVNIGPIAVINESFAKKVFPGEDPIGKKLFLGNDTSDFGSAARTTGREIIGVVEDVRDFGLDEPASLDIYIPYEQSPSASEYLVVRTLVGVQISRDVQDIIAGIDRDQPVENIETMEEVIADTVSDRRLYMGLLTAFGVASFLLAIIAVLGVVSHFVTQRRAELALRIALGSSSGKVLVLVLRLGARVVMAGALVGIALSFVLARWLRAYVFGISVFDPASFIFPVVLVLMVSFLVICVPAARAATADPLKFLRHE